MFIKSATKVMLDGRDGVGVVVAHAGGQATHVAQNGRGLHVANGTLHCRLRPVEVVSGLHLQRRPVDGVSRVLGLPPNSPSTLRRKSVHQVIPIPWILSMNTTHASLDPACSRGHLLDRVLQDSFLDLVAVRVLNPGLVADRSQVLDKPQCMLRIVRMYLRWSQDPSLSRSYSQVVLYHAQYCRSNEFSTRRQATPQLRSAFSPASSRRQGTEPRLRLFRGGARPSLSSAPPHPRRGKARR